MSEVNGNVTTANEQPQPVNGNVRRHGSYSYRRGNGGVWCIYKATSDYAATKYAEVIEKGENGRLQASEIVSALNARERYIEKINFNQISDIKKQNQL